VFAEECDGLGVGDVLGDALPLGDADGEDLALDEADGDGFGDAAASGLITALVTPVI
jgi:hypothetical protein